MATVEDIELLREYVGELTDTNGWTDERLDKFADRADTLLFAAADVWAVKAGEYAGLVNVSESGSSRSLSDLLKQAKEMEAYYRARAVADGAVAVPANDGPVIRRISRAR